jgi:hypothetical protein
VNDTKTRIVISRVDAYWGWAVPQIFSGVYMNDLVQLKKDYDEARREMCTHTMGAVYDLTGVVNYYMEQIESKPQAFRKYITAHRGWLTAKFLESGRSEHHSLAAQQHFGRLHNRLVEMFERLVPEIEMLAKGTGETVSIKYEQESIATLRQAITEFHKNYATDIAAETASEAYQNDQAILASCIADLRCATNGQWTPEIYVQSIEMPGSVKMSEIAELARAGALRLPRGTFIE